MQTNKNTNWLHDITGGDCTALGHVSGRDSFSGRTSTACGR
ncbi:MAG: hypothetical protein AAFZ58_12960 [Pseudomonadota bacterium]